MSADFDRTTAALADEGRRNRTALLAVGVCLLGLWGLWLCAARLPIQLKTDQARIEVVSLAHPVHVDAAARVSVSRLDLDLAVEQGDILVELDREGPELELREAEARSAANQAVLLRMEALAEAQRAVVEQRGIAGRVAVDETNTRAHRAAIAARFSTVNAEQWADLSARGIAAEMDARKSEAEAEGERSLAHAESLASRRVAADQTSLLMERQVELEQLQVEIARLQVEIATDQVAIRRLQVDLDKRTVRAPIGGRLGWVATVSSGQVVSEGQHLATVVPSGELQIVADFPAREAVGRIQTGQRASLCLEAYPWTRYGEVVGWVRRVGTEPIDGRVRVEVEIDESLSAAAPRAHGLAGTLTVTLDRATPLGLLLRAVGR